MNGQVCYILSQYKHPLHLQCSCGGSNRGFTLLWYKLYIRYVEGNGVNLEISRCGSKTPQTYSMPYEMLMEPWSSDQRIKVSRAHGWALSRIPKPLSVASIDNSSSLARRPGYSCASFTHVQWPHSSEYVCLAIFVCKNDY